MVDGGEAWLVLLLLSFGESASLSTSQKYNFAGVNINNWNAVCGIVDLAPYFYSLTLYQTISKTISRTVHCIANSQCICPIIQYCFSAIAYNVGLSG